MPADPAISECGALPWSPADQLCDTTIDVARQIDAMIRLLIREQGYARFEFDVKRGKLGILHVTRSFKMVEG